LVAPLSAEERRQEKKEKLGPSAFLWLKMIDFTALNINSGFNPDQFIFAEND